MGSRPSACAYFLAVATPGPGVAAVISQALARGAAGAPAFIAGFMVGDLLWFLAAVLGLSALAQTCARGIRGGQISGRALSCCTSPTSSGRRRRAPLETDTGPQVARPPRALFLGSLMLTLSNPKPMLFFLALLPTVVPLEALNAIRASRDRRRHRRSSCPRRSGAMCSSPRERGRGCAARAPSRS